MEGLITLLVLGGAIWGAVVVARGHGRQQLLLQRGREAGRLQHVRSGDYPASCSWCKHTTLGRKLFVFERVPGGWQAQDLHTRLQTCPSQEVGALADLLTRDHPHWRRMCSEKCTQEFFAAEQVTTRAAFVSCAYCSARNPASLSRCANCGAAPTET